MVLKEPVECSMLRDIFGAQQQRLQYVAEEVTRLERVVDDDVSFSLFITLKTEMKFMWK